MSPAIRRTIRMGLWAAMVLLPTVGLANPDAGGEWLQDQSTADGAFVSSQPLASVDQGTYESLRALRALGLEDSGAAADARDYLQTQTIVTTEELARRIRLLEANAMDSSATVERLRGHQNRDGGFGDRPGYTSSVIDTARALDALATGGRAGSDAAAQAATYIIDRQGEGGAWSDPGGQSSLYVTAIVLRALDRVEDRYPVSAAIATARDHLLANRDSGGAIGSVHDTAAAILAIAPIAASKDVYADVVQSLRDRQRADGSWLGSVFATGLAVQALALAEQPQPNPDLASVAATVADAETGDSIAGATVALSGPDTRSAGTGADGTVAFDGLPAGTYALEVTADGYNPVSGEVTLGEGEARDLGTLHIVADGSSSAATLQGTITSASDGAPLAGATVTVSGAAEATSTTDAEGRYRLGGLATGDVSVTVAADGHIDAVAGLELQSGITSLFSTALEAATGFTLAGTVTDRETGNPVSGASVTLAGAASASTTTAADGTYSLADLAAGESTASVSADGYNDVSATVTADNGQRLEFSPALVPEGGSGDVPTTGAVTGTVIDDATGAALGGTEVELAAAGTTLTATTDSTGAFAFDQVPEGTAELRLDPAGYQAQGLTFEASAGITLALGEIRLVPDSAAGIEVSGTVVDSISRQPVADAQVELTVGGWKRITLDRQYDNPVVVAGALSHNNDRPLSVRVRNVTADSFEIGMQTPCEDKGQTAGGDPCVSGSWQSETVTYLVVEEGAWRSADGTVIEAHRTEANALDGNAISGKSVTFEHAFAEQPAVLHGVTSANDPAWITTAAWSADARGVTISLEGAEATRDHAAETIAWIAIAPGSGKLDGLDYAAGVTGGARIRGHGGCSEIGSTGTSATLHALASQTSRRGGNGGWARFCDTETDDGRILAHVEEDIVGDSERRHTSEHAAWLAFPEAGSGELTDADGNKAAIAVGHTSLGDTVAPLTAVTDSAGRFAVEASAAGEGALSLSAEGYVATERPVSIPDRDTDLGEIPLRPEEAESGQADLVAEGASGTATVSVDGDLRYADTIEAVWRNDGLAAVEGRFELRAWRDNDGDGAFGSGDTELGTAEVDSDVAPGEGRSTPIEIEGPAPFRDAPVTVTVDAGGDIVELDESNNTASGATECRIEPPSAADLELSLQWQSRGRFAGHEHAAATGPPAVGQFSDDNGDGEIDRDDTPDVVVPIGRGGNGSRDTMLAIFSGDDGSLIRARHDLNVSHRSSPAIGDVDGDGLNEIAVVNRGGDRLFLLQHDGTRAWTASTGAGRKGNNTAHGIAIADLQGDGSPEILVGRRALDAQGNVLWTGTEDAAAPHYRSWGTVPIAADVHDAPGVEVSAGRTLYGADGSVIWHRGDLRSDGTTGVGDFDADDNAEIVLVQSGRVVLLEHTGETIWNVPLGSGGPGGPPTVADFDADGEPEIGVAGRGRYVVLETDGTVKWSKRTDDSSSGATGSSLFDFDADGRAEVLYADEQAFRVYNGATGETLAEIQNSSVTKMEYPIVANVDDDPGAEIVLTSNPHSGEVDGLRVFEAANGQWAPTRSIWNQHSYHITNINEDGTIPVDEEPSWQSHNTYRLNTFVGRDPLAVPDVTASLLEIVDRGSGEPAALRVRVGNAGAQATPAGLGVTFFDGDPDAGGSVLGTVELEPLAPGAWRDVELAGVDLASLSGAGLHARVDSGDELSECREDNNTASTPAVETSALGGVTIDTDARRYAPAMSPDVTATGTNEGSFPGAFTIGLHIEDEDGAVVTDLGETDLGELAPGDSGGTMATWVTDGIVAGDYAAVATLYTAEGTVADTARTPVSLLATDDGAALGDLDTALDRALYRPDASVAVRQLASNTSDKGLLEAAAVITVFRAPDGTEHARIRTSLGDLVPGGQSERRLQQTLDGAAEGGWTVEGKLLDADGTLIAEDSATFRVEAAPVEQLTGSVAVAHPERYVGQSQNCTDTLSNPGERDASDIELRQLVLDRTAGEAMRVDTREVALAAGASQTFGRGFDTAGFAPGNYACALQVRSDGDWRTLDTAEFVLEEPPIDIDAGLGIGDRGRLLVLLDPEVEKGRKAEDPHGPKGSPAPADQREWLEDRLDGAGWSYTIVTDGEAFADELRSNGYAVVALFNEQVKIAEAVQRELVERVHDNGIGLLVAGMHDRRNGRIEPALGLRSKGKLPHVHGLRLYDSEVATADRLEFPVDGKPLRLDTDGARTLAEYTAEHPGRAKAAGNAKGKGGGNGKGRGKRAPGPGLTVYTHGTGRTIDAGFDLLMQGTAAGGDNPYGELLLDALGHVHPEPIEPVAGRVLPLHLLLTNQGIATPGRVLIELPGGAEVVDPGAASVQKDGLVAWPFHLGAAEEVGLDLWVRLPQEPGTATFQATVQTGSAPDWVEHETIEFGIDARAAE